MSPTSGEGPAPLLTPEPAQKILRSTYIRAGRRPIVRLLGRRGRGGGRERPDRRQARSSKSPPRTGSAAFCGVDHRRRLGEVDCACTRDKVFTRRWRRRVFLAVLPSFFALRPDGRECTLFSLPALTAASDRGLRGCRSRWVVPASEEHHSYGALRDSQDQGGGARGQARRAKATEAPSSPAGALRRGAWWGPASTSCLRSLAGSHKCSGTLWSRSSMLLCRRWLTNQRTCSRTSTSQSPREVPTDAVDQIVDIPVRGARGSSGCGRLQEFLPEQSYFHCLLPSRSLTFQRPVAAFKIFFQMRVQLLPQFCLMIRFKVFFFSLFPGEKSVRVADR